MLILGGPCSPQGQVRHVADLFRQIWHGNRNKTAKYVLDRVYIAGERLQHPLELIWPRCSTVELAGAAPPRARPFRRQGLYASLLHEKYR